ncbi:hypothetical protein BY996DRAFT_4479968 [Phakopsora pachyrhizi]|nr:hypothetical protein BY996DRAFT_4479968 [Phakopsora pachyrhizi]
MGMGAEATIALRQLLNDTVIELENLKTLHTEYVELTFAKSDRESTLLLFSKSVMTKKVALINDTKRLKEEQTNLRDQMSMKTIQIQSLLLEKINLH